jgi:FtsZ-binding cell division protein ZapB
MNELERKYREYLNKLNGYRNPKQKCGLDVFIPKSTLAHDLAEIAEKEFDSYMQGTMDNYIKLKNEEIKIAMDNATRVFLEYTELKADNTTLKSINAGLAEMVEELKEQKEELRIDNEMLRLTIEKMKPENQICPIVGSNANEDFKYTPICYSKDGEIIGKERE